MEIECNFTQLDDIGNFVYDIFFTLENIEKASINNKAIYRLKTSTPKSDKKETYTFKDTTCFAFNSEDEVLKVFISNSLIEKIDEQKETDKIIYQISLKKNIPIIEVEDEAILNKNDFPKDLEILVDYD